MIFWAAVLLATALLFCWARGAALAERGYSAIGGEWLIWLLPALVWWGIDTVREMYKLRREERADAEASEDL